MKKEIISLVVVSSTTLFKLFAMRSTIRNGSVIEVPKGIKMNVV